ncbi:MAG: hypothetical protein ABI690_06945 [Chloroflexota bacterium]
MPYEVSWYRQDRVIYMQLKEAVSIQDLAAATEFAMNAVREGIAPVHLIVDIQAVKSIPSNVLEIKKSIPTLTKEQRDLTGWIVLIGMNPLINTFVSVITQLLGTKYRNFKYQKLALQFIAQQDETLADLVETAPN